MHVFMYVCMYVKTARQIPSSSGTRLLHPIFSENTDKYK